MKTIPLENAQEIATDVLLHLTKDQEQIGRFLAASGIGPESIRDAATEPGFLTGILEFYMADEALLLTYCENSGTRPTMIAAARYVLSGEAFGYE